jgi:toxin ParE1/3/4
MKLRFTRRALQDLEEIAAYLRDKNPAAAIRVRGAILESLRDIGDFPTIGRRQNLEGVRKYVTRNPPYLIYYAVDADAVVVLSVRHPARQRDYVDL